jgi:hypothetical protein
MNLKTVHFARITLFTFTGISTLGVDVFFVINYTYFLLHENEKPKQMETETWNKF